jgi:hypothetical protein
MALRAVLMTLYKLITYVKERTRLRNGEKERSRSRNGFFQDEESSIQKLNLSDCKLRNEINNVINALGSNQCLQHLDISGNLMGDVGARLLAKALQINTRLKIINLDRNGISLQVCKKSLQ